MKAYYDSAGIQLFLGDCRDVLGALAPSRAFDVVVADPPYGETSLKWDRRVDGWLGAVGPRLNRAASLWCFGSMRFFMASRTLFSGWQFAQELVWEKHNGSNSAGDRFRRVHELVAQFYPRGVSWADVFKAPVTTPDAVKKTVRRQKRPAHWGDIGGHTYISEDGGPRLMRSVLRVRSCHGRAVHKTQKPEGIVEPLLRYSCPEGGVVLDPFCGSGTTLVVAKTLGLRAIGIEIEEAHCESAAKRLTETLAFGGAA